MTGFQRLCLATTILIFVLIIIGGTVRATDSGLGCPDWPRCHGGFIPKWEKHTLIEYSHRLTAAVAGFMILGVAVWAWRSYRHVRSIMLPSALTFALLLVQGGLGGLTVIHELPPEIVTVHLATALTLIAMLILVTVAAFAHERQLPRLRTSSNAPGLAIVASGLTLAVMLLGAYIAGSGYSLACSGWPLCNGEAVPDLSSEPVQLVFMHRLLALTLGLVLVALTYVAMKAPAASPLTSALAGAALVTYVVQALVGALNIWTEVADLAQIAHLGVGTLLWGILAFLNIRLFALHELIEAGTASKRARPDLLGAAR
jgi:heme A synthase